MPIASKKSTNRYQAYIHRGRIRLDDSSCMEKRTWTTDEVTQLADYIQRDQENMAEVYVYANPLEFPPVDPNRGRFIYILYKHCMSLVFPHTQSAFLCAVAYELLDRAYTVMDEEDQAPLHRVVVYRQLAHSMLDSASFTLADIQETLLKEAKVGVVRVNAKTRVHML